MKVVAAMMSSHPGLYRSQPSMTTRDAGLPTERHITSNTLPDRLRAFLRAPAPLHFDENIGCVGPAGFLSNPRLLGFLPIYLPHVTDSFIMRPDGGFVDEDDDPNGRAATF